MNVWTRVKVGELGIVLMPLFLDSPILRFPGSSTQDPVHTSTLPYVHTIPNQPGLVLLHAIPVGLVGLIPGFVEVDEVLIEFRHLWTGLDHPATKRR